MSTNTKTLSTCDRGLMDHAENEDMIAAVVSKGHILFKIHFTSVF